MNSSSAITLYTGDSVKIESASVIGKPLLIREYAELSYEELIQRSVLSAIQYQTYDSEGRHVGHLFWCKNYLCNIATFEENNDELILPFIYFTNMTKYKDVLYEEVFGEKVKIVVIRTTIPNIVKIVDHLQSKVKTA